MKTLRLILISSMVCLSLGQFANARDWRLVGNGGGGISQDDGSSTLYEKFKKLRWTEIDAGDFVPLSEVQSTIALSRIPKIQKYEITDALIKKRYFAIPEDQISHELFENVKSIYAKLWGRSVTEISIFALTTVESDETLLLPAFFKLSYTEQQTVLLHEALWTVKPNLSYSNMIKVESAFFNMVESKTIQTEFKFYQALAKYVFNPHFLVQSVFLMQKDLPLEFILGDELKHCLEKDYAKCSSTDSSVSMLSAVLKEYKDLRVSVVGYTNFTPLFLPTTVFFSDVFELADWDLVWKVPYSSIPFFHRDRTCVAMPTEDRRFTFFIAIYSNEKNRTNYFDEICLDVARHARNY